MRGPYERLKYDLRRTFECPKCGRHERRAGNATTCLCECQESIPLTEAVWMKMESEGDDPVSPRSQQAKNPIPVRAPNLSIAAEEAVEEEEDGAEQAAEAERAEPGAGETTPETPTGAGEPTPDEPPRN